MYMFARMHFSLSSMIEATWRWAAEHNKIIKHPISGGEFVDVDVEKMSRHIHEEGSGMTQSSNVTFEAYLISKCMYGSFFFMHDMQDTSGSLLDPIENTNAQGSSKDPPALPPVPILSCQFFCMHIYIYIYIVKASYFRPNCLMLKNLKEFAACIHA